MTEILGALSALSPASVREAVALVRDGMVVDLSVPMDPAILPVGDPAFNQPFVRADVVTPEEWQERLRTADDGFHLDAFGGSIHQGTHLDGLAHIVTGGRIFGGHEATATRTDRGWSFAGIETVPPILTRGVLIDVVADRGRRLTGSEDVTVADVESALARTGTAIRRGDAVLVRTGKIVELRTARDSFLDAQPGIGVEAAVYLADAGMVLFGSDTGGSEPQPIRDWTRTVHVELLTRRGIHLVEWMDLEGLAAALAERGRADFLLVVLPLRIQGATGSWVRPIAVL